MPSRNSPKTISIPKVAVPDQAFIRLKAVLANSAMVIVCTILALTFIIPSLNCAVSSSSSLVQFLVNSCPNCLDRLAARERLLKGMLETQSPV